VPIRYTVCYCREDERDDPYAYLFYFASDTFLDCKEAGEWCKNIDPKRCVLILERRRCRRKGPWHAWRNGNVIMEVGAV